MKEDKVTLQNKETMNVLHLVLEKSKYYATYVDNSYVVMIQMS